MDKSKWKKNGAAFALVLAAAATALAVASGECAGQDQAPVGYVSKDRVVGLATAADGSIASFMPAPEALASLAALVDPVSVRMFLCASRPADLKLAAAVGLTAAAAACPALAVEFIAVAEDMSEPKALIADNAVAKTPEIIVYWMGAEVGRMHPEAGAAIDMELADFIFQARTQIAQEMLLDNEFFKYTYHKDLLTLDCKRCHGPDAASGRRSERPQALSR